MAAAVQDLEAIGKLLVAYQSAGDEALRSAAGRQVQPLLGQIRSSSFSPVQATMALQAIAAAPWPQQEHRLLAAAVEGSILSSPGGGTNRNRTQKFEHMENRVDGSGEIFAGGTGRA